MTAAIAEWLDRSLEQARTFMLSGYPNDPDTTPLEQLREDYAQERIDLETFEGRVEFLLATGIADRRGCSVMYPATLEALAWHVQQHRDHGYPAVVVV